MDRANLYHPFVRTCLVCKEAASIYLVTTVFRPALDPSRPSIQYELFTLLPSVVLIVNETICLRMVYNRCS